MEGSGDAGQRLNARSRRITGAGHPDVSAMRDLREVLVPALEALDGFRGGTLLADRDTGDVVGTPYWDSLDHLEGSQTRSSNAAAAFLVLTEGASMEVSVCDGLLTSALPPDLAPEPGSADS